MTSLPGFRGHEHLRDFPPVSAWDDHVEHDAKAHPRKVEHHYTGADHLLQLRERVRAAGLRGPRRPEHQEA
jgi:hypothetical protein